MVIPPTKRFRNYFLPLQIIEAVTNSGIKQPCAGAAFPFTSLPSCLGPSQSKVLDLYILISLAAGTLLAFPLLFLLFGLREYHKSGTANHLSKSAANCFLPLKCSAVF